MLITRHMLFVGFSLRDDNFHRIIDDVRKAVHGEDRDDGSLKGSTDPFGTSLSLKKNRFFEEIWQGDLEWITFSESGGEDIRKQAARTMEIFLDYLADASTTNTSHLLDHRFEAVLDDGEILLRERLERFFSDVNPVERKTKAWQEIEELLNRLGKK